MEETAIQKYTMKQQESGHSGLKTTQSGLVISMENPWLAASPDGMVEDPDMAQPLGLLEVKNPYTARESTIEELVQISHFVYKSMRRMDKKDTP